MNSLLKSKIIVALDHLTLNEAEIFLEKNSNHLGTVKIGLELFLLGGPEWVKKLEKYPVDIFLDLKLYDIPNTIFQAIKSLKGLSIKYLTIHLLGGQNMLRKAVEARDLYLPKTKLLGVSLLTSYDDSDLKNDLLIDNKSLFFEHLFTLANNLKIDGVVHSGKELEQALAFPFLSVCPGIRFHDELENNTHDQKRVYTPKEIFKFQDGSHNKEILLVMGRSIFKHVNKNFELDIDLILKKLPQFAGAS